MMRELAPDLWCAERSQRFFGVELGARMTVVRLPGNALFVHSPLRLDETLRADLASLGEVRYIVAPNRTHHLYVGDYFTAYPGARTFASPALAKKRADLPFHEILGDAAPSAWVGQIDQCLFEPVLSEVVFFHRNSRTLLLTDLVSNIQHCPNLRGRVLLRADGAFRRFALPRAIKLPIALAYRKRARAAITRIFGWDFDRVVMAHGEVVEHGGQAALRRAYAFL